MKANNIIILITTLSLAVPVQARELESGDSVANYVRVYEKAKSAAQEAIQNVTSFFENKIAEWTGNKKVEKAVPAVARDVASSPGSIANGSAVGATPPVAQAGANTSPPRSEERSQMANLIQDTQKQASQEALQTVQQAREASADIPKMKSGVPVFALSKTETKKNQDGTKKKITIWVRDIPRLNVGLERSIQKSDFIPTDIKVGLKLRAKPKALDTPNTYPQSEVTAWQKKKLPVIVKAQPPRRGDFQLGQIVTQKKIDTVSIEMDLTKELQNLKAIKELNKDDLSMLAALMIYEKGEKCHLTSGLLIDLADKREYAEEANFYLGICAHQMGFHSEAVSRLLKVIESENPDFLQEAVTSVVEDLPREYDQKVTTAIKNLKNREAIVEKSKDNWNFILARTAHANDAYTEATQAAEKVSEGSQHYVQARYLYSIGLYAAKKMKEAEESLLKLREWMHKKNKEDKNMESLIAVNLARIRFLQGRYQSSLEEYARIPKDHPLWVQGLIEQGWTQLNVDDPEGAVGNMYSLHSPYFKTVFMPESWVVRTIGYINICQFGDAYRTLSKLEQMHGAWLSSIHNYVGAKKQPEDYYNTVKSYIKGRSDKDVEGLPFQVIREIARQRGFLNEQNALNAKEDEVTQYGFIYNFVKKEQADLTVKLTRTKGRLAKTKESIQKAKSNSELIKNLNEWNANKRNDEQLIIGYEFQSQLYELARKGYLKFKASGLARIDKEKSRLRTAAGKALIAHLKDIQSRIHQIFEGNEFLRYEIFSGSGENIRFQVSGGQVDDNKRIPANVKPQKMLNWEFDGEYWEDEIGSYRSSLKNNCPKNARASAIVDSNKAKTQN